MIDLKKGDCLEFMDELINNGVKVDLTVTSPPYDNLRSYEGSLQWNENIWKGVIKRLYDITANGGVVVWVVNDATIKGSETGTSFKQALFAIDCGFKLHDTMIWNKGSFSAVGALRVRYAPVFEYMFIFTKGNAKSFNPIKDRLNKWAGEKRSHVMFRQKDGAIIKTGGSKINEFGQRFNIWNSPPSKNRGVKHPAIFPEQLANDHIISWSNEGDLVFDPFMGSGTTGKMAIKNNRNFIGIEKVDKYFEIAKQRIEATK